LAAGRYTASLFLLQVLAKTWEEKALVTGTASAHGLSDFFFFLSVASAPPRAQPAEEPGKRIEKSGGRWNLDSFA